MKKILMLFMLLSCMCVYGEEIIIENTKQETSKEERIAKKNIWGPYMREMEQNIKENWMSIFDEETNKAIRKTRNPFGDNIKRTIVKFIVHKNGNFSDLEILQTSGVKLIDDAALNAIKKTVFKPLPNEFNGESVPIEYTFDYAYVSYGSSAVSDKCKTKFCKFMQKY